MEFCKHAILIVQKLADEEDGDGISNVRLVEGNKEKRTFLVPTQPVPGASHASKAPKAIVNLSHIEDRSTVYKGKFACAVQKKIGKESWFVFTYHLSEARIRVLRHREGIIRTRAKTIRPLCISRVSSGDGQMRSNLL